MLDSTRYKLFLNNRYTQETSLRKSEKQKVDVPLNYQSAETVTEIGAPFRFIQTPAIAKKEGSSLLLT